jgi:anti-sigma-K factor RskA
VSAGVFAVGPDGKGRAVFKTESPIASFAKFAVTREKKGGAPAHGGPKGELVIISQ